MKSKYLETISLIHTAYNVRKKEINILDFTFYNLYVIFLRKKGFIKVNSDSIEYLEKVFSEKIFQKYKSLNDEMFDPNSVLSLTEGLNFIYSIDDDVFETYYIEITNLCVSLMLKENSIGFSDAFQPKELTKLMNYFLPKEENINIYNPFAGMCSLGLNIGENSNYYAEEINFGIAAIAELKFLILEKKNFKISIKDSILSLVEKTTKKFDFIAFNPPLNLKLKKYTVSPRLSEYQNVIDGEYFSNNNANALIISEAFKKLKEKGKMVFLIPDSFLFSMSQNQRKLRKYLLERGFVKIVIKLPVRLFEFSSISSNIIVLEKSEKKNEVVKFLDASEMIIKSNKLNILDVEKAFNNLENDSNSEFSKNVNLQEIIENDYNLSVSRYFIGDLNLDHSQKEQLTKFENILSVIKKVKLHDKRGKYIRIGDLSNNLIQNTKTFEDLEDRDLRSDANLLNQDSLLLSLVYKDLKPTFFQKTEGKIYYPFTNIFAGVVDATKIDIDYLIIELQKDYVKKQLSSMVRGTAIQRISKKDLLELFIVIPPKEEQLREVYNFKESAIKKEKESFDLLVKNAGIDIADENSFLRHQIAGSLKNVRGSFKAIKQIINEQIVPELPEVLGLKRNPKLETTLLDYLNILERDITNINKSVNVVGQEIDLTELKVSKFKILDFLTNYVNEVENRDSNLFTISLDIDEDLLIEKEVKEVFINGDKEFLRNIFNNIIENAVKHGFNNTINPENKIEIDIQYDFAESEIQVDFGNTGCPLPENYSKEAFIRKGSKAGAGAGDGVGGWFINEVMKLHNGKFGFTDETGPEGVSGEIVTTMELTFPIELKL